MKPVANVRDPGKNIHGEDKHVSTINDNSNTKALMYETLFITINIVQVAEI